MKYKFCLPAIIILSFFICSCAKRAEADESVVIEDKPVRAEQTMSEEVIFDDDAFNKQVTTAGETKKESQMNNDASTTTITFDGYGNKFEERDFANHPRIKGLLIKTYANGLREIKVYGKGGLTKSLPEEQLDMALNASADAIADAAGLYGTRQPLSKTIPNPYNKKLKPLPSNQFPMTNQPVYQPPAPNQTTPVNDSSPQQEPVQNTAPDGTNEDEQLNFYD